VRTSEIILLSLDKERASVMHLVMMMLLLLLLGMMISMSIMAARIRMLGLGM